MKTGTQTALAVGVGYLLGRRHRLRWTLILAAAGATGKMGGLAGQALRRAPSLLGASEGLGKLTPGLSDVADVLRTDLADAGKAAAAAAVSRRVNALTDTLHDRAEALRAPAGLETPAGADGHGEHDGQDEGARGTRQRASGGQADRGGERPRRPGQPGRAVTRGTGRGPGGSQEGERASHRGGDRESARTRRDGAAEPAPVRRAGRGRS